MELLMIFARYPSPGGAKTRLVPALGAEGAADLQRQMTEHTLAFADRLARRRPALSVRLYTSGGTAHQFRELFGERRRCTDQGEGDLGERLERAFGYAFLFGAARAVAIVTDCPAMDDAYLERAFDGLADHDVVLGPAQDGGYVLLGAARHEPALFHGLSWSTRDAASLVLSRARELDLRALVLPTLRDVDEVADLDEWERRPRPGD